MLRGVNKMVIWTGDLDLRKRSYAEIKKTGANCVRIVWLAQPGQFEADATPEGLDRTIQDAIDAGLIPIVELHDATGDWSKLSMVVDYWVRPDVVAIIAKHEPYLIVNIANEAGDETVTDGMYIAGYTSAIQRMRAAGIQTPLLIDAADWGKNLEQLVRTAPALTQTDPQKNIMYSVHIYWSTTDGADAGYIEQQFAAAVNSGLPFIVGEFTNLFNRNGACTYPTAYEGILASCAKHRIGWLAWEWGPGNEFADASCDVMNMTTNSMYATLKDGWARDVAEMSPNSIKQTSVTPQYIIKHGVCTATSVAEFARGEETMAIYPNPSTGSLSASYALVAPADIRIDILNTIGTVIWSAERTHSQPGTYSVPIALSQSGIYFCRLNSPSQTLVRQVVVGR